MLRVLLAQSLWQLCGSARVVVEECSRQPLLTNLVIVTSVVKTENSNEGTPVSHQNPSDETLCGAALITGVLDATSVSTLAFK